MRFSVLGSGSGGNAILVCGGETRMLVDAGLSGRETARRLAACEVDPQEISAIVITHEHGDHTRGAGVLARRYGVPLLMTKPTRRACSKLLRGTETVVPYRAGYPVTHGDLLIEPVVTVHDAANPVALAVTDQTAGLRLGIATDMGRVRVQVKHALRGCDGLIVESNHDRVMLSAARYPAAVRARIASSHGHLSNQAAARLVGELMSSRLTAVVLAHLSEESNTPDLARSIMAAELDKKAFSGLLAVAGPAEPTPMIDLAKLRDRLAAPQLQLRLF